jgi:shikimate dehydrogenase
MGVPYAEVIGDPIAQSKSPVIHGFWLEKLGLEGEYRATRVAPDDLPAYLAARRADPDWRGCNVTMPNKQAIMPLLDQLSPDAAQIGAVNLVIPGVEGLMGGNSDVIALRDELADMADTARVFDMPVILIGAGGAARAALQALRTVQGLDLLILNRDVAKAGALLDEFGLSGRVAPLDAPLPPAWLILNASSLGMVGYPALPVEPTRAGRPMVVEMVTAPVDTPLLVQARAAGLSTTDGIAILIGQAKSAFQAFFRLPPPISCEEELRRRLTS